MSAGRPAYMDVAHSLGGKRWRARGDDDRLGLALAQRFGLPEAIGRIMAARGVQLDEGVHDVVFRYSPFYWRVGVPISALGLVLLIVWLVLSWRAERARQLKRDRIKAPSSVKSR